MPWSVSFPYMKAISGILKIFLFIISWLVFISGVVLLGIGVFDFGEVFSHISEGGKNTRSLIIIGVLHVVDLFLVAIVFFVMALGFFILFHNPEKPIPVSLPEWLKVKSFTQLKIILWEAILTTLVVTWLAGLAELRIKSEGVSWEILIIPAGILIIALSLYLLKKGEH